MGQLVQIILDNLYAIWPIRIVDADEQAVRFSFGKHVKLCQPGTHFFCPGLQKVEKYNVVYQSLDCGLQALETRDGIAISISINLDYTITDAARLRLAYQNVDFTLINIARGIVGEFVLAHSYDELKAESDSMTGLIRSRLRNTFSGSGLKIKEVRRDVFTRARPYNLLGESVLKRG